MGEAKQTPNHGSKLFGLKFLALTSYAYIQMYILKYKYVDINTYIHTYMFFFFGCYFLCQAEAEADIEAGR